MAKPVTMSATRTYQQRVEEAFDTLLPAPLDRVFARRYGPIPAVRSIEAAPSEPWGVVGQVRTVRLADGGSMREELTHVQRPTAFGYTLTDVSGPMKLLASRVEGQWRFEPVGAQTRITWQWDVHAASRLVTPLLPVFALLWRHYARQSLQSIERLFAGN